MHETIVGEKVPEDKLEPALPSDPAAEPAAQPTAPEEGG